MSPYRIQTRYWFSGPLTEHLSHYYESSWHLTKSSLITCHKCNANSLCCLIFDDREQQIKLVHENVRQLFRIIHAEIITKHLSAGTKLLSGPRWLYRANCDSKKAKNGCCNGWLYRLDKSTTVQHNASLTNSRYDHKRYHHTRIVRYVQLALSQLLTICLNDRCCKASQKNRRFERIRNC